MLTVFREQIASLAGGGISRLIAALLILIVGWPVALLLGALVRGALRRTGLDARLDRWIGGGEEAKAIDVARWVGRAVYYVGMVFVLISFFEMLGLTIVTEPLNRLLVQVFEYAPRLVGGLLLLLTAWVIATVLRFVVMRALRLTKIDERLGREVSQTERQVPLGKTLGAAVYWVVFLLFLPAVLDALALRGLLEPVQGMVNKVLGFLPNILAAGLIALSGWLVARVVRRIVVNLLEAAGTNRLSERVGLDRFLGHQTLSHLLGLVVYVLVLIPVLTAALNALALEAITRPAANMLDRIMGALPALFSAVLVLAVSYVVGRILAGWIISVLTGAGFNAVPVRLGLAKETPKGQWSPSDVVGYLVLVAIMLFAGIEALGLLGFERVADLVTRFTGFAGQVILGLLIFGLGLYLANLAAKTVQASGAAQARLLAMVVRIAILVFAGAMGLREMGIANDIILVAFGASFGAVAIAAALAFGLGGREIAARELRGWVDSFKSGKES